MTARVEVFLPGRPPAELARAVDRLSRTEDVVHVAVMPDAHVAEDVGVGTVTATRRTLLPAAAGGDLGCGMLAVPLDGPGEPLAAALADPRAAARLLAGLARRVPSGPWPVAAAPELPEELASAPLSAPALERRKHREGRLELGTLGRGNHFLELQRDEEGAFWLLVHSGSRALGPAVRDHHAASARRTATGLAALDAEDDDGRAYLADVAWARAYARHNRRRMAEAAAEVLREVAGARADPDAGFDVDHDHVQREEHEAGPLWVHRKGAMGLAEGQLGVVPGSMGTATYHVTGRALPAALRSSAHGAGRALPRGEARRRIGRRELERQLRGVLYDHRAADTLRDEAPSAYKDVAEVVRAQRELTRVVRRLVPVLVHKGG